MLISILSSTFLFLETKFATIHSEDCESKGMRMVTTKKECHDAAVLLKVTIKPAKDIKKEYEKKLPPGCSFHKYHRFTFLHMNKN